MKTPLLFAAGLFFLCALFSLPPAFGQGDLTPPPGPPTPTMKTLDQVEPRIIVNDTNTPGDAENTFIISAPGSYYLTGNITGLPGTHGISIQANDVTLDLNGFALVSGGGSSGVNVPLAQSGFCIRNGSIRGWAGGCVKADTAVTLAENLRLSDGGTGLAVGNGSIVKDCVASGNETGFYLPDRTQISNCTSTVNLGRGFDCGSYVNLMDCISSRNGGDGIVVTGSCSVSRCSVTRNLSGNGILAGSGCNIANCTVSANGEQGIRAGSGTTIRNCTIQSNYANGIYCDEGNCHIIGNTCDLNDSGIVAVGGMSRVDGNSCTSNAYRGMIAAGFVIRNSARGNGFDGTSNFSVAGACGPVVDMTAGGTITANSPWANFSY